MSKITELPKQIISGIVVVIAVILRVVWEILIGLLGEIGAFISLFLTAVALISALKYTGVI